MAEKENSEADLEVNDHVTASKTRSATLFRMKALEDTVAQLRLEINNQVDEIRTLEQVIVEGEARIVNLRGQLTAMNLELEKSDNKNRELADDAKKTILECDERERRLQKRIKRLENDKRQLRQSDKPYIDQLKAKARAAQLAGSAAQQTIQRLTAETGRLSAERDTLQDSINSLRKQQNRLASRTYRAKTSLASTRTALRRMSIWSSKKSGAYTPEARRLARFLTQAGCAEDKVAAAIVECGKVFGVKVIGNMSRRTVGRAKKEGGLFGLIQLGREVQQADCFGESSDGTTHRRITHESRHINLMAPTYEPGVDDSDTTTWKQQIRFGDLSQALDHTAQRQFEGSVEFGEALADSYTRSPLAKRDGATLDKDDYFRKQTSQNMDHAADVRKKFKLTVDHKAGITYRDLGEAIVEDMSGYDLLGYLLQVSNDDVRHYAKEEEM
ncbi:hypothetical protein ONZ45_g7824 [Pleurotus djamor]|nr:hypothetical protein ONZ45_g7824 [Pleurotus djamor]